MLFVWILLLLAGLCYFIHNILMSINLKIALTKLGYKLRFKFIFLSYITGMLISDVTLLRKENKHIAEMLEKRGIPLLISSSALNITYSSVAIKIIFYGLEYCFIMLACIELTGISFITIILFIILTNSIEIFIDLIGYNNLQSDNPIKTLSEHYNAIDGDADEKAYNSDVCVQRYFQRRKTFTIKKLLKASDGDIVLDIGCGSGVQIMTLKIDLPKFVIGTDISLDALTYAKTKNIPNSEFVQCDAQYLPFKNYSIDKIICAEVLEHLPHPDQMINETYRILKNNGSIVITTPNENSIWGLYEFLWDAFGRGRNYGETHLRFFSIHDLNMYFKSFTTRYTTTLFFLSPFVALLNNHTLVRWSKRFDAIFEKINFGVSIVYYAKK